jgi:hypothetical protein
VGEARVMAREAIELWLEADSMLRTSARSRTV